MTVVLRHERQETLMTPPSPVAIPRPSAARRQLHRRVKRGIVAGYLHGLSPRHRPVTGPAVPAKAPA
jgi:hypothetical protein